MPNRGKCNSGRIERNTLLLQPPSHARRPPCRPRPSPLCQRHNLKTANRFAREQFDMNLQKTADDWAVEKYAVGQPVLRTEDPILVRGAGCYTDDVSLP